MTKRVFFLGAGFSKAIDNGYPLMKELTKEIETKITESPVAGHYNEIPEIIKKNVESLLTYLSTDFPWKSDTMKYEDRALYEEIIKLISQYFSNLAKKSIEQTPISSFSTKLSEYVCNHFDDCNFITLNYDLLLEVTLKNSLETKKCSVGFSDFYKYPMAWIGNRNYNGAFGFGDSERANKPNIPAILKLHGSANWFWAGINPSDVIYYRSWNRNEKDNIDMGLKPYIIPPVMDKNAFYNHVAIHALWQQAEKLLKEADEICIIGFSFPQTDLSVKYLFQSALKDSNAKIYVVNADPWNNLKANYTSVFYEDKIENTYTGKDNFDGSVAERFVNEHLISEVKND